MASWGNMPLELLGQIFQYVPRNERLTCSLVCQTWHKALNQNVLWKHLRVYIDTDLSDRNLFVITTRFQSLIRSLELAWSDPSKPSQFIQPKFHSITKQACDYFLLLNKSEIELQAIILTDWYHTYRFKKMIYLLSLFIRNQSQLAKVSFLNANLNRAETLKLLSACIQVSSNTITYLDIRGSYHNYQSLHNMQQYIYVIEKFENLEYFSLDYSAFSNEVIDAFLRSQNRSLRTINIEVHGSDRRTHFIFEDSWKSLCEKYPKCRVYMNIHGISHFEDLQYFLMPGMPLKSFTMLGNASWDQSRSRRFRQTLKTLITNYRYYLEYLNLRLKYNKEDVDDLLLAVIKKCKKLQKIELDCIVRNLDLIKKLCDYQTKTGHYRHLNYFEISPKNLTPEQHIIVQEMYHSYISKMQDCNIEFAVNHCSFGKFDILVQTC